jgi:hypothetical protein
MLTQFTLRSYGANSVDGNQRFYKHSAPNGAYNRVLTTELTGGSLDEFEDILLLKRNIKLSQQCQVFGFE